MVLQVQSMLPALDHCIVAKLVSALSNLITCTFNHKYWTAGCAA
jgi:hypothetical protein